MLGPLWFWAEDAAARPRCSSPKTSVIPIYGTSAAAVTQGTRAEKLWGDSKSLFHLGDTPAFLFSSRTRTIFPLCNIFLNIPRNSGLKGAAVYSSEPAVLLRFHHSKERNHFPPRLAPRKPKETQCFLSKALPRGLKCHITR